MQTTPWAFRQGLVSRFHQDIGEDSFPLEPGDHGAGLRIA